MDVMDTTRKDPLVTVIMPAYNAARFLEAAIASVQSQTVENWELLVIDDGSSDESCRIAEAFAQKDPRINFLPNPRNMGVSATRNRGIELAKGTYIAFLDSDDVWHPEKLQMQLEAMEKSGAGICYTSYAIVDEHGQKSKESYMVPGQVDFDGLLKENVMGCSTVMLRAELLENERFGETYYHEDYVLWLTLLKKQVKAVGCPQVLTDWRLIANSRSFNKFRSAKFRWLIYRNFLNLPMGKSVAAFAGYATASLRKYR